MSSSSEEPGSHAGPGTAGLVIGALGIVYGDIGTSPLYALKECFSPEVQHRVAVTTPNVLGVLSLVFWALMLVVTVKYLTFVMKADNEGSGGILALLALVPARITDVKKRTSLIVMLVLFGAALLYGDGVITPAISVLSAVEGLEVATSTMKPLVVPITCAVLFGLFMVQSRGTAKVGRLFGPIMIVWFLMIAGFGIPHILANPGVLWAVDPRYAMRFFLENHWHGFLVLGAVVLCITGGEALYADMGHFGRTPIRLSWLGLV